ncbi:MAG: hypothetical protein ABJG78_16325 [Cyclobacteriaceae bacterium]
MDKEVSSRQNFEDYLQSKKIDPKKFMDADQTRYEEFEKLFDQVHPESFTQQKLFLINKIRRKYILEETVIEESTSPTKKLKPKILPKPKLS